MKIESIPHKKIKWDGIPITKHPGETGNAYWRTVESGNIRIRLVEYSPGYRAVRWCCRGHVIHLIGGEMFSELKDGTTIHLKTGMTYIISDSEFNPHRTYTEHGASILIID